MAYIHGTAADDFDLTDEQTRHVQEQTAAMILELASHKFDRIGALKEDGAGSFVIGKDMEMNEGPFETAGEYYTALSMFRFRGYADRYFRDNLDSESVPGLHLPFMFTT